MYPLGRRRAYRLHIAAESGDDKLVSSLIAYNWIINDLDENNFTPLHTAVKHNKIRAAEVLLQNNAEVDTQESEGDTPLHDAVWANSIDLLKLLLSHNASVHLKNAAGQTALHIACGYRCENMVKLLLDAKPDVNARTKDESSPLHYAAKNCRYALEITRLLLASGADIDAEDQNGKTVIMIATQEPSYCTLEYITYLIKMDASVDNVDVKRLLQRSIGKNDASKDDGYCVCLELLNRGVLNAEFTALQLAVTRRDKAVFDLLISRRASIHLLVDSFGRTSLTHAVKAKNLYAASVLLRLGADPNACDNAGRSILAYALFQRDSEIFQLLLDHDAHFNEEGYGDLRMKFANEDQIRLLARHLALQNSLNRDGKWVDLVLTTTEPLRAEYDGCCKELEIAKSTRVCEGYFVTYYDLLTKRGDAMLRYLRSENVRLVFENVNDLKEKFPLYADLMKRYCSGGLRQLQLEEECQEMLERAFGALLPYAVLCKISEFLLYYT